MNEFAQNVAEFREYIEKTYPLALHIEASQFKRAIFYTVEILDGSQWIEISGLITVLKVQSPNLLYCCTHLQDWTDFKKEGRNNAN